MKRMPHFFAQCLVVAALAVAGAPQAQAEGRITVNEDIMNKMKSKQVDGIKDLKNPTFIVPRADLVVGPRFSGNGPQLNSGYCGGSPNHEKVSMLIKNKGLAASKPAVVEVSYGQFGTRKVTIPPLGVNAKYYLNMPLPNRDTIHQTYTFNVTVDATNAVKEISEANNAAAGSCILVQSTSGGS